MRPVGAHGGNVMYFVSFWFRSEIGFLNCDTICMCIANKQFELLEFVFDSVCLVLVWCLSSCGRPWSVCQVFLVPCVVGAVVALTVTCV